MIEGDTAAQVVADYITSTTDDGVWPFFVWVAFQEIVAPPIISHLQANPIPTSDSKEEGR